MIATKHTYSDILIVVAAMVLAFAVVLIPLIGGRDRLVLEVTSDAGKNTYPMEKDRNIEIVSRGIALTVTISGGEAFIAHSDCDNQICVKTGHISLDGQSVVCAPAGVAVMVRRRGGGANADALAG